MAAFTHESAERLRLDVLALLAMREDEAPRMTYEEFLEWADEDTLAEWVDGKVIMASPASLPHQRIVKFLLRTLSTYVEIHQLGEICEAPFQMKLPTSGREPDLLFIAANHLDWLKATYLDGLADLAVEVISPESAERDRGKKFFEYEAAGVPEYWLLDPDRAVAEFYQVDAQGHYQTIALDADGLYTSRALPGFRLRVAWLWQDPLPDPVDVLLEIDREAYAAYLHGKLER